MMKCVLLSFLVFPCLAFSFVPSGDNDYFILKEDQYNIIFDKQYLSSIDQINEKVKKQMDSMSRFKKRTLDEPINIILFSSKSQISNAFATIMPFYTIGMYPTGIISFESLSETAWFDGVFEHELNHVFQMSHSKYPRAIKKIFRLPSFLQFFVLNPYPNVLLPRFITEGDAILKESLNRLDQNGGRLYSGEVRAFVYSQIRHYQHQIDKFTKRKLLRFTLNNPHFGREIYYHGGYLMAMLAETYSQDTIHSFFKVNKKIPSKEERKKFKAEAVEKKLSSSFGKVFSFRYFQLFIKDIVKIYFNRYLGEASKQRYSTSPVLFETSKCTPFNSFKDELFFLTSDYKSRPVLNIFNKKEKKWTDRKIDLPPGKVFNIEGKYYSRSTQKVAPNVRHYSLFSKGYRNNKKFDSKYVTDIRNNKILSIDTKNNMNQFKLYLNDKFYTNVHSNALFDQKENIYYFKQKGIRRTLYRNKTPVFSYAGYYGNLLEIDNKGEIYFTGASRYGSSVYRYNVNRGGRIFRASSSDTIVQAQKINDKEFIVCEITPYKYEYKITPLVKIDEKPVLYKYNFKKNNSSLVSGSSETSFQRGLASQKKSHSVIKSEQKNSKKTLTIKTESLDYKPYSALKHIRFGGGNIAAITFGLMSGLGINFILSDYLLKHLVQLSAISLWVHYDGTRFKWNHLNDTVINLQYYNSIYPLNWGLGYTIGFMKNQRGYLHLFYPWFKKGRWSSSTTLTHILKRKYYKGGGGGANDDSVETVVYKGASATHYKEVINTVEEGEYRHESVSRKTFNINYSQKFPFNYFLSNKATRLQFFVDHKYQYEDPKWDGLKGGVIGNATFHIGRDYYLLPEFSYSTSLNKDINPVTMYSYLLSFPGSLDKKATSLSSNLLFSDDTTTHPFIMDIYSPIFQRKYSAKSIGTAGVGFKKMLDTASSSLITLAFRCRWIILEQLLSSDFLSFMDETNRDQIRLQTDALMELARYGRKSSQKVELSKYTNWLEWTFGLEYFFSIENQLGMLIGFAFGFRTPLKFWEQQNDDGNNGGIVIGSPASSPPPQVQSNTGRTQSVSNTFATLSSRLWDDLHFQLYFKKPF